MSRAIVLAALCLVGTAASARMLTRQPLARPGEPDGLVSVYLPPSYDASPDERFPVLVLLHGLGGAEEDWRQLGNIEATLDRAIAAGQLPALIAVIPDGHNGYWANWPSARPGTRWEDLVEPVVTRWVDGQFRTSGVRAIAGVSMGGFGALSIAFRHPSRYVAALSFSGALFTRWPTSKPVYWSAFGAPSTEASFAMSNPLHLARLGRADGLAVWLDCGKEDAPKFTQGLAAMAKVLRRRGVDFAQRLRPGNHTWGVWNAGLAEAMPWLGRRLRQAAEGRRAGP